MSIDNILDSLDKGKKHVKQVISFIGEGKLLDGSQCSTEFRNILTKVQAPSLERCANQCLNPDKDFNDSARAFQDIVNEIGRRLGFEVKNGRYQGTSDQLGHDGLWELNDGYKLVIEVKTSNIHSMPLEKIANYRNKLIRADDLLPEKSGTLIVVGSDSAGDLASQIRGSKYSWDMRYITVSALLDLLKIQMDTDDPGIIRKITDVLIPRQYTKLDGIVDLVFSTAESIINEMKEVEENEEVMNKDQLREECIMQIQRHLDKKFIRQKKTSYADKEKKINLISLVSKTYHGKPHSYWYTFGQHHKDFLSNSMNYVAFGFGFGLKPKTILIPSNEFLPLLDSMSNTKEGRRYWHVHINEELELILKGRNNRIDLNKYKIPTGTD